MKKTAVFVLVFILFAIAITTGVVAESSGGGASSPLEIVSSSIANGESEVELDREIQFTFSKNIANISVAENNYRCFTMVDSEGEIVPIEVIIFDDQLEREKRNDIIVKPEKLQEAKEYTITISPDLQAKSGHKLDEEIQYVFSTIVFASKTDSDPSGTGSGLETGKKDSSSLKNGGGISSLWIYIIVIAAIVIVVVLWFKKRHGR